MCDLHACVLQKKPPCILCKPRPIRLKHSEGVCASLFLPDADKSAPSARRKMPMQAHPSLGGSPILKDRYGCKSPVPSRASRTWRMLSESLAEGWSRLRSAQALSKVKVCFMLFDSRMPILVFLLEGTCSVQPAWPDSCCAPQRPSLGQGLVFCGTVHFRILRPTRVEILLKVLMTIALSGRLELPSPTGMHPSS